MIQRSEDRTPQAPGGAPGHPPMTDVGAEKIIRRDTQFENLLMQLLPPKAQTHTAVVEVMEWDGDTVMVRRPDAPEMDPFPALALTNMGAKEGDFALAIEHAGRWYAIGVVGGDDTWATLIEDIPFVEDTEQSATGLGRLLGALGASAVAIGRSAIASADAVAVGRDAGASGSQSVSVGHISKATAQWSNAIGQDAQATAARSTAIGNSSRALGERTIAIGRLANVGAGDPDTAEIRANVLRLVQSDGTASSKLRMRDTLNVQREIDIDSDRGIRIGSQAAVWGADNIVFMSKTAASGSNWSLRNGPSTTGTMIVGTLIGGATNLWDSGWTKVADGYTWHFVYAQGFGWGWIISTAIP